MILELAVALEGTVLFESMQKSREVGHQQIGERFSLLPSWHRSAARVLTNIENADVSLAGDPGIGACALTRIEHP